MRKIVPGLLVEALGFGHLPTIFVPAGPMLSGLVNKEKASIRQLYVQGKVDRKALLACESASSHSARACTFYGTANSNINKSEAMYSQASQVTAAALDSQDLIAIKTMNVFAQYWVL